MAESRAGAQERPAVKMGGRSSLQDLPVCAEGRALRREVARGIAATAKRPLERERRQPLVTLSQLR